TNGTLHRYNAAKNHVGEFLAFCYQKKDIPIQEVDYKFITGFEYFLKSEKDCAHNTVQKYIVNFKKIIRIAYANQWIEKDPFFHWKGSWKNSDREYLTEEELQLLIDKEFSIPRLEQVKDIFLFCCYTGLAYADVKKLSGDDIIIGINGKRWIKTKRQKTDSLSSISLLLVSESILDKYASHPYAIAGKGILPVLTNQKSNAYLKEIADLCGIKKNLTTHLARHTFATTVTISNGVSMESVSKMLGHKSLKTTQIYAKVVDKKVGREMDELEALRTKLGAKKKG
ncbi:MAG: site-specific integrase, partial [Flavobacteriaceae bacterium]|nr:site-specific integrase [Flavobacteriaceae bacterium]